MDLKYIDTTAEIKASESEGTIEGYGSTFGGKPDSYGDIVEKGAFSETLTKSGAQGLGVSLLWQHRSDMPAGVWTEIVENEKGLKVRGSLALKTQTGNDAYEFAKMGAIRGLSIGYTIKDYEIDNDKQIRYIKRADLWEISLVTFPANARATITSVKSIIENSKDKKELEKALRDFGISREGSLYICSLVDPGKFPKKTDDSQLLELAETLKQTTERIGSVLTDSDCLAIRDQIAQINEQIKKS